MDSSVPLIHHDPDRSWITDPDPDHPKGMHPELLKSEPMISDIQAASQSQFPLFKLHEFFMSLGSTFQHKTNR